LFRAARRRVTRVEVDDDRFPGRHVAFKVMQLT